MSFVLFNISDEIVSREKAGVAYQEGNNKVGASCSWETGPENLSEKIMEICQDDPGQAEGADGAGCFNRCGKLGQNSAGASVYPMNLQRKLIEYQLSSWWKASDRYGGTAGGEYAFH